MFLGYIKGPFTKSKCRNGHSGKTLVIYQSAQKGRVSQGDLKPAAMRSFIVLFTSPKTGCGISRELPWRARWQVPRHVSVVTKHLFPESEETWHDVDGKRIKCRKYFPPPTSISVVPLLHVCF